MFKPGDMFGDYRVVERLGKGGMGEVWLVEIESRHACFAVKLLDPGLVEKDGDFRKRFLHEAQIAMSVESPHLLKVYDVGQDPETGYCYLIMECLTGGSLAERLASKGPLPIDDAIAITYQVAMALAAVNEHGIVHRDIKPDNIMFDGEGNARLTDLGIAKVSHMMTAMTMTMPGSVIGTPAYMSPEQMLDSHHIDIRSDIYSLGLVFYEMLTGKCHNAELSMMDAMANAMKKVPIPDVRGLRPEVPEVVAKLVAKMCAIDRNERVSSPQEVMTALSQIANGIEVTMFAEEATWPGRPRPGSRNRFWLWVVGGVVAAVLFGIADFCVYWYCLRDDGRDAQGVGALSTEDGIPLFYTPKSCQGD